MDVVLQMFSGFMLEHIYMAVPIAFLAGVISAFSPCVLTTIPLVIGYMGNSKISDRKKGLLYSLVFTLGLSITFIALGFLTAYVGMIFSGYGKLIYLVLAFIMIGSSLNILGIINFKKQENACSIEEKPVKKGLFGIFTLGLFGGFAASPCATPVLAAILSFVASRGNPVLGVFMLMAYSIGNSILVILAGVSVSTLNSLVTQPKYIKLANNLKNILAVFILFAGLYVFYLAV